MSRAYQISVSESTKRHIRVEDGFQAQLEMLGILPAPEMATLLGNELAALGFQHEGGVMRRVDDDGIEIVVDLDTGTVTARLAADKDVDVTVERSRRIYEENLEQGEAQLRRSVQAELENEVDKERDRLSQEVTDKLEKKLTDLRRELDRATNRATAEALKIRARQLGEVKEVSENPETGEITIKVEV